MPGFYLGRHPATSQNVARVPRMRAGTDEEPSSEGRIQIAKVAAYFKNKPIDEVYASTCKRSWRLGDAVAKATGAKMTRLAGLDPWTIPALADMPEDKTKPILKYLVEHPSVRYQDDPNSQTFAEFDKRAWSTFQDLLQEQRSRRLWCVAFTHGRNLVDIWSHLRGGGPLDPKMRPYKWDMTDTGDVFLVQSRGLVLVFKAPVPKETRIQRKEES